jgi:hypothetical protein
VIDMLTDIGSIDRARPWVERALASGQRIMAFGHRVYLDGGSAIGGAEGDGARPWGTGGGPGRRSGTSDA